MLKSIRINLNLKLLFSYGFLFFLRFNPGDIVYIKYLIIQRKKKKYFFRVKEFFGKCIAFRNRFLRSSVILRKAVKLNEIENIFILDSPFILGLGVQKDPNRSYKKLLFLRRYSGKYSRVNLYKGFKKKSED
jgi:ribosomal protein L19